MSDREGRRVEFTTRWWSWTGDPVKVVEKGEGTSMDVRAAFKSNGTGAESGWLSVAEARQRDLMPSTA